jgi:hypothetical protein
VDVDEDDLAVARPPITSLTVRVTMPSCSHSFEWLRTRRLPEDSECPICNESNGDGGPCEDYPCCGHAPGECGYSPTHHSDYWYEWISQREAQGYDLDDPDFYAPFEEY